MAAIFFYSHTLRLLCSFFFLLSANSLYFQKSHFDQNDASIFYLGSAAPAVGVIDLNMNHNWLSQVGWAIYGGKVLLWDSNTGQLTDFNTQYSFSIDTQGLSDYHYGHGVCFFLAPVGFQIPPNSAGGFLGLFNYTTIFSSKNQIVHVEFDSFPNPDWNETTGHVGINKNSIASSVFTRWNASFHSGDSVNVQITYSSTTKNLSVSWRYLNDSAPGEATSLFYLIDLKEVLPEWVQIGFSGATGMYGELHTLQSWEFNSTLVASGGGGRKKTRLAVIPTTVIGGLLVVGTIIIYVSIGRKKETESKMETKDLTSINDDLERGAGPRRFSYSELALATNNFSNDRKLGQGGFGAVYRGYFVDSDLAIAVKKISKGSKQGKKEYVTEVKVISQLRHRNLVRLFGWCHDEGQFLLVYEFMPNGSLDSHLFGKKSPLVWIVRHKIALGLASAILYLHEEWERCVVHRDIKSSNVMLDSNYNVKLGDFGLAKLVDHEIGPQTTGLAGTIGYLAPEYASTGRASKESDVYSYGVVVLEITTGRKANDVMEDKDGEKGLVEWAWDHYGRGELIVAMDQRLRADFDKKQVECLMVVGLWCAHPDQNLRPSIRQAIHVINFEAALPILPPKKPVPMYHVPSPPVSSVEPSITSSLQMGR